MPKTDRSARNAPTRRQRWLVPPDAATRGEAGGDAEAGKRTGRGRASDQPKSAQRKHFIEPYPYTSEERGAIDRVLADCGLGDATAREIFIGAIAYDLAVLRTALAAPEPPAAASATGAPASSRQHPEPPAGAEVELELAARALALAQHIEALDEQARTALLSALADADPFRREYGPAYLDAVRLEATRIAGAAGALAGMAEQAGAAAEPTRGRAARAGSSDKPAATRATRAATATGTQSAIGFIRHAASVYEQCFDARPDPAPDAQFARVLNAIATATGIAVPTAPDVLRRALGSH
jgi:hypothetical protein